MNNNIEIYYIMFKSILANLKIQNMLDNYTRCYWFLIGLLKKMQSKLMKKYNIDSQNSFIMKFERLYDDAQKRTNKLKHKHDLNKVISEETL